MKIPLHINGTPSFFQTRRPTADEIQSCEKIFINPNRHNWNPCCKFYEINEISMLNYKGDITQGNCQEHHLVDHDMDNLNIAFIKTTAYDQNIYNITDNAYCAHVYNTPCNPDSAFVSALNQS